MYRKRQGPAISRGAEAGGISAWVQAPDMKTPLQSDPKRCFAVAKICPPSRLSPLLRGRLPAVLLLAALRPAAAGAGFAEAARCTGLVARTARAIAGRARIGGLARRHGDLVAQPFRGRDHRDRTRSAFRCFQMRTLGSVAEGDRDAALAGARCGRYGAHTFRLVGQFVVDDMRDAGDVDAAGRNVGRNQDARLAGAELVERALAGAATVAVDCLGGVPVFRAAR